MTRFLCSFHVQENANREVNATMIAISRALMSNGSDAIQSENVDPKHISKMDVQGASILGRIYTEFSKEKCQFLHFLKLFPAPERCPDDTVLTIHGEFFWDESLPQETRRIICEKPDTERATRLWYDCSGLLVGCLFTDVASGCRHGHSSCVENYPN